MNVIPPVENTNNIRYADFVRVQTTEQVNAGSFIVGTTYTILKVGDTNWISIGAASNTQGITFIATGIGSGTGVATTPVKYMFSSAPSDTLVPAVDSTPFTALGSLIKCGDAQRDIKSTANQTTFTFVGIDQAMLGFVLSQNIKGAQIQAWHGFYNTADELLTTGGTGGLYQFFNGYINSYQISEQWLEDARTYVGTINVTASSTQIILQNRVAGRYTNDNSWQFYAPNDTSMARVAFITNINYNFGKGWRPSQ